MTFFAPLRRLLSNRSGLATIEFALGAPFLLTAGLWGMELANFAVTNMQVGQLTVHLADNGSRIGDTSTLTGRKIYEADINDMFVGAAVQSGQKMELLKHGRVILSSLQVDDATGNQYIHWQRCRGMKVESSTYGNTGDGLATPIAGLGPTGEEVEAQPEDAVIFVEVFYDYQPIISSAFLFKTSTIQSIAAFTVRDDRDLTQVYQRDPAKPDEVSVCNTYNDTPAITG